MEGADSLQTLAEVSVALAGFSSLLVVLRRAPSTPWSPGEGSDLFIVVGGSLMVLVFALLPLPVHHFGASDATVWTVSSAALATGILLAYAAVMHRRRQLLRAGITPDHPHVARVAVQAPLALVAILALSAADLLVPRGPGPYLLVLILFLALASLPLIFLVVALGSVRAK